MELENSTNGGGRDTTSIINQMPPPPPPDSSQHHHHQRKNNNTYDYRHQNNVFEIKSLLWNLLKAVLLFSMVTLACMVLYQAGSARALDRFMPNSFNAFSFSRANHSSSGLAENIGEEQGLEQLLKRAAMPNKTVIMTPLNEAWIEPDSIFDIFLESFRTGHQTLGLLRHIVVINLDQKAYDHCLGLYLHCYFLKTNGPEVSGEAQFMTQRYLNIVWKKIDFLRTVLELGYSFIFTDADIVWFRNPFPHFYPDGNLQVACDGYRGNSSNLRNAPNTGFMYVKSCNQTIEFYKFWYKSREFHPRKHDQDAFNMIKFDPFMKKIGLEIKFLDTLNFGGFCQPSRDLNSVCTMHANCCVGLDNKIHDLKILLEDWRKYKALPEDVKKFHPPSWTVPQRCGPASYRRHSPRKRNGSNN